MSGIRARGLRAAYASERMPATVRWALAAAGMRDWFRILRRTLKEPLGGESRAVVDALGQRLFERRYAALTEDGSLRELAPRDRALAFAWLYQLWLQPRARWIVEPLGGAPRGAREWRRARHVVAHLDAEAKWREVTVHLGEMLIVLTVDLPERLPRARQIVAEMCHDMGARYAVHMRRALALPDDRPVANAIEILRTSEYVFRVNPKHETAADETTGEGFIDGDACPWYPRPGWQPQHCGIFGQFQAGVCSEFGLSYKLTTTIPKHGGDHCRVDLRPIRKSRDGAPIR